MGVQIINKIFSFIMRLLMVSVIFLVMAIVCKSNVKYKEYIYNNVYEKSISFSYFKNVYNKYLGGVFPKYKLSNVEKVFDEDISYYNKEDYYDGVLLNVRDNYLVPVLNGGIVVYIGNKDNYGNVIIVEDNDGVDTWYGNICNSSYNLYDNIDNGGYIGESCDNHIYLVFSKGNEFLNYDDYLDK